MENFETSIVAATAISANFQNRSAVDSTKALRRATRVLNRVVRSSCIRDQQLRERVCQAVGVVNQTNRTETALLQSRPTDGLRRIASRIVRRLSIKS